MDTVEAQNRFAAKYQLPFPLLADTDGKICDTFRVEHPKNRPARETFLFRNGKLLDHDRSVKPVRQAADILEKIAQETNSELPPEPSFFDKLFRGQ